MREDVYNPIKRFLLSEKVSLQSQTNKKFINQLHSKQEFFSLKKQHSKKIASQRKKKNVHKICSFDQDQNSFDSCQDKKIMAYSQDLCILNRSMEDDLKAESAKTVDSYQQTATLANNFSWMRKQSINYSESNSNEPFQEQLNFKIQYTKKLKSQLNPLFENDDNFDNLQGKNISSHKIKSQQLQLLDLSFKKDARSKNQIQSIQKIGPDNPLLKFKLLSQKKKPSYIPKAKHFTLIRKLGEGTYSKVYQAWHKKTGIICAMKVLDKKKVIQMDMIDNVIDQVKILSLIQHPNIIKLWGFFADHKNFYIVLEYCTDGELYNLIRDYQKYDNSDFNHLKLKVSYIYQLSSALNQLHTQRIMHRDIKPQNILISFTGQIKLCDFGWGKIFYTPEEELRKTFCGTPLYLAPQVIQRNYYTKTIDTWALGILTFQLLTGRIPFQIKSLDDLQKIVYEEVCYQQIKHFPDAVSFIKLLLQKNGLKRQNIEDLLKHEFFNILKQKSCSTHNLSQQVIKQILFVLNGSK